MSERPVRYQRSFSGMVGALIVLLLVVVGFVAFRGSIRDNQETPVPEVDYAGSLPFIREKLTFPVLAPPTLPEGWKATSLRFEESRPQSWHLGVLTADGDYVGIDQSHDRESDLLDELVDEEARKGDPVEVAGKTWDTYSDDGGDHALVRRDGGLTTVVVGTLPVAELFKYVDSLRAD